MTQSGISLKTKRMDKLNWKAYGTNIEVEPVSKNKIIGDTSKYYLYGKVLSVGSEVNNIKVGDMIAWTLWGMNEILDQDGTKHYFVQDNPDFIIAKNDTN